MISLYKLCLLKRAKQVFFIFCVISMGFITTSYCLPNAEIKDRTIPSLINSSPVFGSSGYSYSISESAALADSIGFVSATDADNDPLIYSIKTGNTNSALSINSLTGTIAVAKYLNHHTQDTYSLIVKVTDPGGLSSEASVIINVLQGSALPDFTNISWGTATPQPYGTHEVHGEAVNGELYVFGGYDVQKKPKYTPTKRAYVYDPASKAWIAIADLPQTPNGPGFGGVTHEGLTTDGTDIYFAGGYLSNSDGTGQVFSTKQVWKYNVSLNTYTALPNLPVDLGTGQLKYLNGKLHYMGGANKSRRDTSVHYALNLDSLSLGWKVLAPILNACNHPGSAVYEGKIYFIGGAHNQDAKSIKQKTVEVYDPATNTWTLLNNLPVGLDHISSSVVVMGNRILVLGGETAPNVKSKQIFAYSPADNTWAAIAQLPSERSAGVAAVLNGLLYYTGGNYSNVSRKGSPVIRVDSFTLINADNDTPIKTLVSGDTIDLAKLPTSNLNIRANTNPVNVGSVAFSLSGPQNLNVIDNQFPYTPFGDDNNNNYYPWTPTAGKYTLNSTPYNGPGGTGTPGQIKTIVFTVINNATTSITLMPVADAYVRNGSYATINYGSDTALTVKSSPSAGFTRYSYLKFSLNNVSSVSSAVLRLYGHNTSNNAIINLSAYGVANDTWKEDTINFNNAPPASAPALSIVGVSDTVRYYEFDVTDFIETQFTGDKIAGIVVKDPKNSDKSFTFNSRESSQYQPQLFIRYSAQNSTLSTLKNNSSTFYLTLDSLIKSSSALATTVSGSKVYPNPMHTVLNIEFQKNYKGNYELQIVDPVGKVYDLGKSQMRPGLNIREIDISNLSLKPGIYFLRIHSDLRPTEIIKLIVK